MSEERKDFNVAEAKRRFSDLLGRVAYGGETILITRRGKPMAKLVPVEEVKIPHPADIEGWLEDDDPFFAEIDAIVATRIERTPRVVDGKTDDDKDDDAGSDS